VVTALEESYAACERLARAHYENFPVASRLLPRPLRRHVAAVYAFARTADDFADEPGLEPQERLRLLGEWRRHLHSTPESSESRHAPAASRHAPAASRQDALPPQFPPDTIFPALHDTIMRFTLPVSLFDDLLSAFEQDVTTTRYESWAALYDYCRRSAHPVGRIVLRLNGYDRDDLDRRSDEVCTALQLTNFWQDLAIDWSRGRLYVPVGTCRAHGADTADLDRRSWTPAWRHALDEACARTREHFSEGRPVCDGVGGRLRYELRATWLGGGRILDRLERAQFDVFTSRPTLGTSDALVIGWKALWWT
jgi:squalene synthase HpnC